MKAVVHHRYGPPREVLALEDVAVPAVGEHDVLLRVHAAAVNWADWALTLGVPYMLRLPYGLRAPRDGIRGTDVAGTVEQVGSAVGGLRSGQEVFGWCTGAFAEYAVTAADHLVTKPATLAFDAAAAVPMAGMVALQAMRDIADVQPGSRVLVNGASGGIGSFTVQIAKAMGAEVTGVSRTDHLDRVRSIGADHVIDYTQEEFTESGERYDAILDIADNKSLSARRRALTRHGTLIPNSGAGNRWIASLGRIVKARVASPFVSQTLRPFLSIPKQKDLLALRSLMESGEVTPVLDRTYPFTETAEAVEQVGRGHARGKVAIAI
jgi:NADPH:quinone reductase-like Zn-dependent oxidoreductase